jgi:hypothetical protein
MLTIRKEQWELLAKPEVKKFEDWMHDHVLQFFPAKYSAAGPARIRELIRTGRERAAAYGITVRADVSKYIDLMVVFGRDFDTDPRYPWAGEILNRRSSGSAKMRAALEASQVNRKRL